MFTPKLKKVLIITYYWPPSGGAGVQRWLKFSKYLPENGWEPIILTVDPAFSSYPQIDESLEKEINPELKVFRTKSREFYSFYKKISKNNIPYGGFSNENKKSIIQNIAKFIRGNIFIPDPRRGWIKYAYRKASELIKTYDIDTVVTTSPPHSTQLIGLKLKRKHKIKWIADLRDPWTDIYYYNQFNHTKVAVAIDRNYERKVISNSDIITTVSEDLKRIFSSKVDLLSADKIHVIPNGYDEEDFKIKVENDETRKIITYTGTISDKYEIDSFIEAVNSLDKDSKDNLIVRFIGNVAGAIYEKIKNIETKVEFIDYVPHSQAIEYMLKSNMLLLIIPNVENNKGIVTGKFYEYLATGNTVLAIGPKGGDLDKIINETGCGKLFDYKQATKIRSYISEQLSGRPIEISTNSKYSRESLTKELAQLMHK